MKVTSAIALLCASVVAVSAETNAERMARGLPPNAPARRGTRVAAARRNQPSSIYNYCNTGSLLCCNSVTSANPTVVDIIEILIGIVVPQSTVVGFTCSPLTSLGLTQGSCQAQPVCCENNNYEGVVAIGCSPINVNT